MLVLEFIFQLLLSSTLSQLAFSSTGFIDILEQFSIVIAKALPPVMASARGDNNKDVKNKMVTENLQIIVAKSHYCNFMSWISVKYI